MRSTNRKRVLIVSTAIILLCMFIIVGMTWALFTDTKKVSNHLKAGDLSITLKRTELTKTTLDTNGYLKTMDTDYTVVNFTKPTEENVFGLATDDDGKVTEKIVPGSKYVAKMQIENHSDVAFGYWIKIVCTDKTNGADLANQLKVTVNTGNAKTGLVGNGLQVGSDAEFIDVVTVGQKGTFTVTVEFVDDGYTIVDGVLSSTNDDAEKENLEFDLVVYAVQVTAEKK